MGTLEAGPLFSGSHYVPRRTKANPKHSLFGCDLELLSAEERSAVQQNDLNALSEEKERERWLQRNKYVPSLPDDLRNELPAKALYEKSLNALSRQTNETRAAQQRLDSLEKNSLYFQPGVPSATHSDHFCAKHRSRRSGFDAANCKGDSNILGLSQHQASQVDTQRLPLTQPLLHQELYAYHRHKGPDWLPKEYFMKQVDPDPNLAVDLPRNIQHKFGSSICQNVLCDTDKVNTYFEQRRAANKPSSGGKAVIKKGALQPKTNYDVLGQALRQDFFPGMTSDHHVGVTKTVYNNDVHKRRVKDPDEWRYQRDEMSTWAERNVINECVKKAWETYHLEKKNG
ncbi:hypothetical protein CAPTEDRAFT_192869 [Capitella teleta]|uniref:Uncharacterized protein n=1 Tax=Capitella teleta TaxID=283909 RepID=R7UFG1_CAPTE|nr:hypothetical protein CAPTEDRAFT_192869 [Capitella teleta]|eukprot:ELU01997.1 hypothetical protein CAPTEDRAFT_192869 [Capitella teleta]